MASRRHTGLILKYVARQNTCRMQQSSALMNLALPQFCSWTLPLVQKRMWNILICVIIYIPNNCMLLCLCHGRVSAQLQKKRCVTTHCTCQTSALTLYFSSWLFTYLSPADISDERILFVQHCTHITLPCSSLSQWNTAPWW